MKNIFLSLVLVTFVFSCKNDKKTEDNSATNPEVEYATFGEGFEAKGAISATELAEQYKSLKAGDTLITKATAKINEVCSTKGCWMRLDLENDEEVMVRFKDYGFFMPLNAKGEVIINGKAYVTEITVDELKHYAEDAGKTEDEIAAITESEVTLAFEADGVLLKQ
ncbi:MAG: DUF4920 domain-containing protein [Flavobacteriaceae bacterium]|nr:DUF4920 domain-containing protein [Flavobacteriaceae bacterium]